MPLAALAGLLATTVAHAQEAAPAAAAPAPALDAGNTAWMLTSTALVLMMTIPGLALFYAGMVRKKNVLATVMQSFAVCCLVTVLWFVAGYSLAFSDGGSLNASCCITASRSRRCGRRVLRTFRNSSSRCSR